MEVRAGDMQGLSGPMTKSGYESRDVQKLVAPAWTLSVGHRCMMECPDGRRCVLDTRRPHTLHICAAGDCACHERERYEAARAVRLNDGEAEGSEHDAQMGCKCIH